MPLSTSDNAPATFPTPNFLTLSNFKRGVITLIDKSRLPQNALEQADNIYLYEDGQPGPRPGVDWYGTSPLTGVSASPSQSPSASRSPSGSRSPSASTSTSPSSSRSPSSSQSRSPSASTSPSGSASPSASTSPTLSPSASLSPSGSRSPSASTSPSSSVSPSLGIPLSIDGFDYFDDDGPIHLIVAAGGTIFRSLDDGNTWTACSGATIEPGVTVNMIQYNKLLYITNGVDVITMYDGTTTLTQEVPITAPTGVGSAKTGLAANTYTYMYEVSAVNTIGFSEASASTTIQVAQQRNSWNDTTDFVTVTWTPVSGATRYDIYMSTDAGLTFNYLSSTLNTEATYKDDGEDVIIPSTVAPTENTTQGPIVEEFAVVGGRLFGVRDHANPYRIWYSNNQNPYGAFAGAYDGGYLEFNPGSKFIPVKVQDYRDGKNNPVATVWCRSADGQGCIYQMTINTVTDSNNISVNVPSFVLLPGSRGTGAYNSVVSVLNDYLFYNSQAFYNLGSRAQFLNLLSTDEVSANIRPTVQQITSASEDKIASTYFNDGTGSRVYFSVPIASSENNTTMIYDTDRQAWLPTAFTIGFSKFLRYTDTGGTRHLLCLKPGDAKLSEISSAIQGDYGVPFNTSLLTGLYPTVKDRFDFQFVNEGEVELSNPTGEITVELLGSNRTAGFTSVDVRNINVDTVVSNIGWDTFNWDVKNWDDTSIVPTVVSESSVKRYFNVQQELNNVQWHVTTSSLTARYILRSLQTWGTATEAGHPTSWRLTS